MRQIVTPSVLALLICFAASAALLGQSRGRPQTFESVITLPNSNAGPPASLAGTVVSEVTGEPLSGATVTLKRHFANAVLSLLSGEDPAAIPQVKTDEKGSFSFEGLRAADYDLNVEMDGYLPVRPAQRTENSERRHVTLASGERVSDLKIGLMRSARLEGRIRTDIGEIPGGIALQLIRNDSSSVKASQTIETVAQSTSNADGTYSLSGFPSGGYVLIAGSPLALNGESAGSFAARIDVPINDAQTLDFSLDSRGGYRIRGKFGIDGTPVVPAEVSLTVRVTSPSGTALTPRGGANIPYSYNPQNGTFEIPDLFPGIYQINASLKDSQMAGHCAAATIVVSRADVDALDLTLKQCL